MEPAVKLPAAKLPAVKQRRKSTIYTKSGDSGLTSLFNGERKKKNHPIFDALGTLDLLNCKIGLIAAQLPYYPLVSVKTLHDLQRLLLEIGSFVATPRNAPRTTQEQRDQTEFSESHTDELEIQIDLVDATLPRLSEFILPGGTVLSAHLHEARALCRNVERCLYNVKEFKEPKIFQFINRLSDYLFVLARYVSSQMEQTFKVRDAHVVTVVSQQ